MKKYISILMFLTLTACGGTVHVYNKSNNIKQVEFTDPPFIAFPREAAFAHPQTQAAMIKNSIDECPTGYKKIKEQYLKDNGNGKDALIWEIECTK